MINGFASFICFFLFTEGGIYVVITNVPFVLYSIFNKEYCTFTFCDVSMTHFVQKRERERFMIFKSSSSSLIENCKLTIVKVFHSNSI